jgi:hypothetical protein
VQRDNLFLLRARARLRVLHQRRGDFPWQQIREDRLQLVVDRLELRRKQPRQARLRGPWAVTVVSETRNRALEGMGSERTFCW